MKTNNTISTCAVSLRAAEVNSSISLNQTNKHDKLSVGIAEFKNDLIYFVFCWFLPSYYFLYIMIDKMLGIFPNAQSPSPNRMVQGAEHSGQNRLGEEHCSQDRLVKFHIRVFASWEKFLWKAAVWENVFGNVPNILEMKS